MLQGERLCLPYALKKHSPGSRFGHGCTRLYALAVIGFWATRRTQGASKSWKKCTTAIRNQLVSQLNSVPACMSLVASSPCLKRDFYPRDPPAHSKYNRSSGTSMRMRPGSTCAGQFLLASNHMHL